MRLEILSFANFVTCLLTAAGAQAAICQHELSVEIDHFENVKRAVLTGRYSEVAEALGPSFAGRAELITESLAPFETYFPDGFDTCATTLQRVESPSYLQDVSLFFDEERGGFVGVYLAATRLNGQWVPISFYINTDLSIVLDRVI